MKMELNWDMLEEMKPSRRGRCGPLTVTVGWEQGKNRKARGTLRLSAGLRRALGEGERVRVRMSPDRTVLVLDRREEGKLYLPKSGMILHTEFVQELETLGVLLPAVYEAEWDEEHQAWVARNPAGTPPAGEELNRTHPVKRGRKRREMEA